MAGLLIPLIRDRFLGEIYAHAREAYPEECCGMILASGVRRCENMQDDLHHLDSVAHPRTARTGFAFTAEDDLFLIESFGSEDPVLAVYHSHPDAAACFSRADAAGALRDGRPAYPHLFHLVIACGADRVGGSVLYGGEPGSFCQWARFGGAGSRSSTQQDRCLIGYPR